MKYEKSEAHTKYECIYHIVFIPKYRRKIIYNQLKADIGRYIRNLFITDNKIKILYNFSSKKEQNL